MQWYMQTAMLKARKSQTPSEAKGQKMKATSQVKPKPKAKRHKPKTMSQAFEQMDDFSSKMQQKRLQLQHAAHGKENCPRLEKAKNKKL